MAKKRKLPGEKSKIKNQKWLLHIVLLGEQILDDSFLGHRRLLLQFLLLWLLLLQFLLSSCGQMHAQPVLLHTLRHTNAAAAIARIQRTCIQSRGRIRTRPIPLIRLQLLIRLLLLLRLLRRLLLIVTLHRSNSATAAAAAVSQFVERLARQRAALRGDRARLAFLALELLQPPPLLLRSLGGRCGCGCGDWGRCRSRCRCRCRGRAGCGDWGCGRGSR